ncbi:endonuclease/exonuclease/phosphatase family protein [Micromonospora sp. NPDC005806]|uniref:endonuclease/exonuclease/phosphatase family protein n=1 Tax=Micromonospora sp. NPDC005806 TaxID=3364234 RepID=UPI0036759A2E
MTWNVGNLFPAGHPDGPPDAETYDVKIAYLATTIRGLNPDVVALQEVGDPRCARDLA